MRTNCHGSWQHKCCVPRHAGGALCGGSPTAAWPAGQENRSSFTSITEERRLPMAFASGSALKTSSLKTCVVKEIVLACVGWGCGLFPGKWHSYQIPPSERWRSPCNGIRHKRSWGALQLFPPLNIFPHKAGGNSQRD